jgi:hypothetical protein
MFQSYNEEIKEWMNVIFFFQNTIQNHGDYSVLNAKTEA